MGDIFVEKTNTYNLRDNDGILVPSANATAHGIETIWYIGSRLWQSAPSEIKESNSLEVFIKRIKIEQQLDTTARFAELLLQT